MTRGRMLACAVAAVLGIAALDAGRRAPGFSLAGDSLARLVLGVAAGWALVGAGLALEAAGPRVGARLLVAAGWAWLAAGLATPGARFAPLFTLGLMSVAAAPALIGHASLLAAAGGRLSARLDRAAVVALYAALVGLVGVLPTLLSDPAASGCATCPADLLVLTDAPAADLARWGIGLGAIATASAIALALWRVGRAPAARRKRAAPITVPACAFLAVVTAGLGHDWRRGVLGSDSVDQALWTGQAIALLGVAAGVAWLLAAGRRRRSQLAHVVVKLANARRPGGLRDALAEMLADPDLDLLHASPDGSGWIDAAGRVRTPPPDGATTELIRDGEPVALLCHRPALLDDPRLPTEIERGVRLGLEHERLQGALRLQLEHLRRSRADVAAAGEAERRLLERDLHDGAQQRLVAFAFALGIASRHAAPEHVAALMSAQGEVHEALAELRELAHGIYPVALAEAGLAAAVESLGDRRPGLRVAGLSEERFAPAVEETAYFAIATLAEQWSPAPVALTAIRDGEGFWLDLHTRVRARPDLVDVEDRVEALGGSLSVHTEAGGQTHVRVALPCA